MARQDPWADLKAMVNDQRRRGEGLFAPFLGPTKETVIQEDGYCVGCKPPGRACAACHVLYIKREQGSVPDGRKDAV